MDESTGFGAPWDDAQRQLASGLTEVWLAHGRWPTFQWVDHRMARLGLNALEVLESFPVIGGSSPLTVRYADVSYERSPAPRLDSPVCLTIAGLTRQSAPDCQATVDLFIHLLREAASLEREVVIDPLSPTELSLTSQFLAQQVPAELKDRVRLMYDVLHREPVQGLPARGSGPDGNWHVLVDSGIRWCQAIDSVEGYLEALRRRLVPPVPSPQPRALPSPLGLVTAMSYLDVTWELHSGRRLVARVTDLPGLAALGFDAGNEDEFRSRCSTLMDLVKNWNVPGLPGHGGGHPLDRLSQYLAAHLDEDTSTAAIAPLSVFDSLRTVRDAQQHAHLAQGSVDALAHLGLPGPPYDWQAGWATIRERVTFASLDLQAVIAQLPRRA